MICRSRSNCISMLLLALVLLCTSLPVLAQYVQHPRLYLTSERIERIRGQHWQADSYEWGQLMNCAVRSDMDGVKAQALAYVITEDESWASTAIANIYDRMDSVPVMTVGFNTVGEEFQRWALAFDWLYNSSSFTNQVKQDILDYVGQVPRDGSGKWNWYPDWTYFNGSAKVIWGPPLWGLATHGDNPLADDFIDNGLAHRWEHMRTAFGHGPDNLAVVRGACMPQGLDYAAGTVANICRWLEAMRSATGGASDFYDEAPAFRQYLKFFVHSYYYSEDFIRRPEHGHNAHKSGGYLYNAVTALLILQQRYSDTLEASWAQWWMENIDDAYRFPGRYDRYYAVDDVLFSDHSISAENPFDQPLAYFAEGNGMWICRSNWSEGTQEPITFTTFRAGNWTWFNQNHWDQGNYTVYSHGAPLLVEGGIYDGGGAETVINYHHQTISHNCILVKDPEQTKGWHFYQWDNDGYENTGGQNRPYRQTVYDAILDGEPKDSSWENYQGFYLHDMSDILRRSSIDNEDYSYAFADMTNAYANVRWEEDYETNRLANVDYRPKVTSVTRHWLYLRDPDGHDNEYIVAFDRVSSVEAGFKKISLLHFIGEPLLTNGSRTNTEVAGHIETWDSDRFSVEYGGAVLHGALLLPENQQVRKVGGTGYEYWVNGHNYDPFPDSENDEGGVWRLEVMPEEANEDDLFLTVLQPNFAGTPAPLVVRVSGGGFEGAAMPGWVLLFADEETQRETVEYNVDLSGQQRHLICDMTPDYTYRVYRNGNTTPIAEVLARQEGIVDFESPDGGSFQVTQGAYTPDETPPVGEILVGDGDCGGSQVMLHLSASDTGSGMQGGHMRFSNDGANWSSSYGYSTQYLWTLASGDGVKTVYALFSDAAGNWMDEPVTGTITLDSQSPDGVFSIVENNVSTPTVTLYSEADDDGCGDQMYMRFSNDGASWSQPEAFASSRSWDLDTEGTGSYTVWACFSDQAGNWCEPLSDTVDYVDPSNDVTPPTGTLAIAASGCRSEPDVELLISASDEGSGMDGGLMRFSNNDVDWSRSYDFANSIIWTLAPGDGDKTVYAIYADADGNWMSDPASAGGVTLDDSAPVATFAIEEAEVEGAQVTLVCDGYNTGCGGNDVYMRFSNDGVSWSPIESLSASRTWDYGPQGDGVYTIYARFGDELGNWSDPPFSDTVELILPDLDETPPEVFAETPEDGSGSVPTNSAVSCFIRDLSSGVDPSTVSIELNGEELNHELTPFGTRYMLSAYPLEEMSPNSPQSVLVFAGDMAGNQVQHAWSFTTGSGGEDSQPPLPPTGLAVDVDEDCAMEVSWDASFDPSVVIYRVSYAAWPDGEAVYLAHQEQIGALIEDQPDGSYWVAVEAMDNQGQYSAPAVLAEPVVLTCDAPPEEPDDPIDGDDPPMRASGAGGIWPPGVMQDLEFAPLQVSDLSIGWTVRIFTVSGRSVMTHRAFSEGEDFTWDLLNNKSVSVARGLYLVRVFDAAGNLKNKGYYLRR